MYEFGGVVNTIVTEAELERAKKYVDPSDKIYKENPKLSDMNAPTSLWMQSQPHPHANSFQGKDYAWGRVDR